MIKGMLSLMIFRILRFSPLYFPVGTARVIPNDRSPFSGAFEAFHCGLPSERLTASTSQNNI